MKLFFFSLILVLPISLFASPTGPHMVWGNNPPNYTNCTNCHNSFPINSGDGIFYLEGLPDAYFPGEEYEITVQLGDPDQQRWGFQLAIQLEDNSQAGAMTYTDPIHTQSFFIQPGVGIMHTETGTYAGTQNLSPGWQFTWTAPGTGSGTVGFYGSGNASNYGTGTSGDYIYTLTELIEEDTGSDITIALDPFGAPIQIEPGGGSFDFNISVTNSGSSAQTVDVWTMATLPGGAEFGPIILFENLNLNPGASPNRDRVQAIPASAPSGNYTYDAYVGTYPNSPLDEDHFGFLKFEGDFDGIAQSGWTNWGEDFKNSYGQSTMDVPVDHSMLKVYPNPFNPVANVEFALRDAGEFELAVFDLQGRQLEILRNGSSSSQNQVVSWNADNYPSGIYVFRIHQNNHSISQKALLIK